MWPTLGILFAIVVLIQDGVAVKRSRTVAFSALRVLQLLQQKDDSDDSNDSMLRGEESDLYRQLQYTSDGSRYKLSIICTVWLCYCISTCLKCNEMLFVFRNLASCFG